ncbi:hypothetical protein GBAR_LOCUS29699, partial [Geodia barretti]
MSSTAQVRASALPGQGSRTAQVRAPGQGTLHTLPSQGTARPGLKPKTATASTAQG